MSTMGRRINRLVYRSRPAGCFSTGRHCTTFLLVGDGSDDPPDPELPEHCPACGRPHLHHIVRLIGVDVTWI